MKIIYVLILLISVFFIYRFFESDNADILVEFQKMRPIKEKVNVYYNGFKVGRTTGLNLAIIQKIYVQKSDLIKI